MKLKLINVFFSLVLSLFFSSCGDGYTSIESNYRYTSIESYSNSSVNLAKDKVYVERFGFTFYKPKDWDYTDPDVNSETAPMLINISPINNPDTSFTMITIEKFGKGSLKANFDEFVKRNFEADSEMNVLEKGESNFITNFSKEYFIHAHRTINGKPAEVEVFFAVEHNNECYLFGALTDLNEEADNHLTSMIDCIKMFEAN
jgi:hypothetical protein